MTWRIKLWMSSDPVEGSDFIAIHFFQSKSLLWGDPKKKRENSGVCRNLLRIVQLSVLWTLNMSATRR